MDLGFRVAELPFQSLTLEGLERFEPDVPLTSEEDAVTSIVAGVFLTY